MAGLIGLDVAAVQQLGTLLKGQADALTGIASAVDGIVDQLGQSWNGPDAEAFRDWWQSQHRPALESAGASLSGLGQSALNNASAQEAASGGSGGGLGAVGIAAGAAAAAMGAAAGKARAAVPPQPAGSQGPAALPGTHRTAAQVQAAYEADSRAYGLGPWSADGDPGLRYQCTAWAAFRWKELGYAGDVAIRDGGAMAAANGGSSTTPPSPGAMASYPGHVMIVEEVLDGGSTIRVSEMNTDSNADEGRPEEYGWTSTFTRQPDGTWLRKEYGGPRAMTFATLPR